MTAHASRSGSVVVSRWPASRVTRKSRRNGREGLRPPRPAEVADDERDEDDDEPHLEGRQDSHGRRRYPEQGHRRGGEKRGQRRLVYVAEGRVPASDDVVHLVAVEAICARQSQQYANHQARGQEHGPGHGHPRETLSD